MPFSFLIGYLIRHYLGLETVGWWVAIVLCGLGLLGVIVPAAIRWLFVGWMILAFPIGWTISHLVLALIFYGMFFPIGSIARLFGYDPLQLKRKPMDSYWLEMKPIENKDQYFRQF